MKGSDTIYSVVMYHFTPDISVEIEYEAKVEWEKTDGSFSTRAETPEDYHGIDEFLVINFEISKATLVVEGDDLRIWDIPEDQGFLSSLAEEHEVRNVIHKDAEEWYRNNS